MDGFSRANCDVAEADITEDVDEDVLTLYSTLSNFTGEGDKIPRRFFFTNQKSGCHKTAVTYSRKNCI